MSFLQRNVAAYAIHGSCAIRYASIGCKRKRTPNSFQRDNVVCAVSFSSSTDVSMSQSKNVAIVGGGLAGLSTAWFLLKKSIEQHER